ncbi:nickel pincer cofactor biosynthesis protein LarB [Paenibacillus sp. y28]
MDLERVLKLVQAGELSIEEAMLQLGGTAKSSPPGAGPKAGALKTDSGPETDARPNISQTIGLSGAETDNVDDLGFAQLDLNREKRTGFPEVIYGEGKTPEQIASIMQRLMQHTDRVLATRIEPAKAQAVMAIAQGLVYHETARCLTWFKQPQLKKQSGGYIAVVCAGTSDLPVAEEAALVAECTGSRVEKIYDVGVAGLHRLLRRLPVLREANVVIVVAGMEGALASVVGGLVSSPVIAVPTSVGYGANLGGVATLLAMLNSCATGVTVVNIDNGFGAGYTAGMINRKMSKE